MKRSKSLVNGKEDGLKCVMSGSTELDYGLEMEGAVHVR